MKLKEYWKLKKLRELAEELDYDSIVRMIDDDDEINEAYHEFKEAGLSDRELQDNQRVYEFKEKNSVRIYAKIWDALNLYTDLEVDEVLEVYEGNCTDVLFSCALMDGRYLIGELKNYHTIAPAWEMVYATQDFEEAHKIFIKQLNLISGF